MTSVFQSALGSPWAPGPLENRDRTLFHTEQSQLARGKVADLDALRRAIILETLAEQLTLLGQARDAGGGFKKGIKAGDV